MMDDVGLYESQSVNGFFGYAQLYPSQILLLVWELCHSVSLVLHYTDFDQLFDINSHHVLKVAINSHNNGKTEFAPKILVYLKL